MVLATPIGGKDIDPELEAKLKDKKSQSNPTLCGSQMEQKESFSSYPTKRMGDHQGL